LFTTAVVLAVWTAEPVAVELVEAKMVLGRD
jgi:hypothetical protein